MKKQILSGALALSLLLGSASAFSDITNPQTQQAAAVLNNLAIMQGEGGGRFNPNGLLTRAQFCKLAVTALGIQDVSPYRGYTVFPDVPYSHWAAGYINAAVKQSAIRDRQIIRGFADGTFGPDKTITYGETCTMLLRMLGYTVDDVGPFWPNDYIAKAESLKLTQGAASYGANDVVKRGDAAILLLNTLQASPKEGDKLLMNNVAASSVEGSILLATSETDGDLRSGQATFYESSSIITRPMEGMLDKSLVGTRGTVLFDKTTTSKVRAFVPETGDMDTVDVKQARASELESEDGQKYKVPRSAQVVLDGELLDYSESYFDLTGRTLNLYYDSDHQLELMSVAYEGAEADGFVYGTSTAGNIPQGYSIAKNGVTIGRESLKKYDLIITNPETRTVTVSDRRVTGYLQDASPAYAYPEKVTVLGKEFSVTEAASAYFKNMKYNDKITLLLDSYGNVQAAFPASEVSASMVGVFTKKNGTEATVELTNSVKISGTVDQDTADNLIGQLVSVTAGTDDKLYLSRYSLSGRTSGSWAVAGGTLGSKKVSANVRVYEMVAEKAPAVSVSIDDIRLDTVPSGKIRGTLTDTSGSVTGIVLDDVTGYGWQYGIGSGNRIQGDLIEKFGDETGDPEYNYNYSVVLTCWAEDDDGTYASIKKTYPVISLPSGLSGNPIGIPRGMGQYGDVKVFLPTKKLTSVGTVGLSAFDTSEGVKTTGGYYPLQENIGAYVPDYKKMVSLREAKANFTEFTLYADDTPENGGMIRIIIAK
ncbi:MAG: S-layer homology domain-containing protein [Intestinibacillus sp.]